MFWVALCWFLDFREFTKLELGQTKKQGAHKVPRCAYPPGVPRSLVAHSFALWPSPETSRVSSVQEKIVKIFHSIWTPFGTDFLKKPKTGKNQQLALGTRLIG
jgi:hypothetical protein